jgi:hypothetical protein
VTVRNQTAFDTLRVMTMFKRRAVAQWMLVTGWVGCLGMLVPAHAGPASGNLLVEWRVVSSAQAQQRQTGIARGGMVVSTTDMGQRQDSVHSVLVLNGGRARLYAGRTVPQTTWQFLYSGSASGPGGASSGGASPAQPSGNVQLLSQTTLIDLGQGLTVRPRWKGGAAPVELEVEAQSRNHVGVMTGGQGMAPDGQTQRQEVMSTVAVPLGQWVVVAQSRSNQSQQARGSLSTTELDDTGGELLELRVTLP